MGPTSYDGAPSQANVTFVRLDCHFQDCTAEYLSLVALRTGRMATVSEVTSLPKNVGQVLVEPDIIGGLEKGGEKSWSDEKHTKSEGEESVSEADVVEDRGKSGGTIPDSHTDIPLHPVALTCTVLLLRNVSDTQLTHCHISGQYTDEQYKQLKKKIDRWLLPLMWLCYGIQQIDKTSLGIQATFGLREDTGLVGQQYSWLTTIFYLLYLCFEFPSNILIQRYKMGRTLSVYMICWGFVVLGIGFAQNFTHLMVLRALQGMFECCIIPGFILVVGTWYTTREHPSRTLVFQSANAGFGVIASLILYGIGSVQYQRPDFEAWRYMSYFLGSLTVLVGCLCLFLLGTPSEVRWLSPEEKAMANTRILSNNTGHDRTGIKSWKWEQALECLVDPCFWFAGFNGFLCSVPNGGLNTFGHIITTSFGFTNLRQYHPCPATVPRSFSFVMF